MQELIYPGPPALPEPTVAPLSPDGDLQAIRRLDWRFLLPEPDLGRVLYLGPELDTLSPALQRFSRALTIASSSGARFPRGAGEDPYDLAVVQAPHVATLKLASRLLRRDGWLYCELDRPAWLGTLQRATRRGGPGKTPSHAHFHACRTLLKDLGFRDIRAHWHFPDFEGCRWITPIEDPRAGPYFLSQNAGPVVRSVVSGVGWWMASTGLLPFLVPYLSLVARNDRCPSGAE